MRSGLILKETNCSLLSLGAFLSLNKKPSTSSQPHTTILQCITHLLVHTNKPHHAITQHPRGSAWLSAGKLERTQTPHTPPCLCPLALQYSRRDRTGSHETIREESKG